jgi:hypothetical protein
VKQAEQLAASVGGRLNPPQLRWKYLWIEKTLGYQAAHRAQFLLPNALRSWDRVMFQLEGQEASQH